MIISIFYRCASNRFRLIALACLLGFACAACSTHTTQTTRLQIAETIAPPKGLFVFCVERLDYCGLKQGQPQDSARDDHKSVEHETLLKQARDVNNAVNQALGYKTDQDMWGQDENWSLPLTENIATHGDCEDFALEKRARLIAQGVPAQHLALATAWSRRTGDHAVLIVRTDQGDYVLDNASAHIRPVHDTSYRWHSLQTGPNLLSWVRIKGYDNLDHTLTATAG